MKSHAWCFALLMSIFTTEGASMDAIAHLETKLQPITTTMFPNGTPQATRPDIEMFGKQLGFDIPEELKRFLGITHLGLTQINPIKVGSEHGRNHALGMIQHAWKAGVPKTHLPFCEDNEDYICIDLHNGSVVWWLHDSETFEEKVYPTLNDWATAFWKLKQ